MYDPFATPGNIDCSLCEQQDKCASSPCAAHRDPCKCALSTSGCSWNENSQSCVVRGSSGSTPCGLCPSQPICRLAKPQIIGFDPRQGSKGSGVNNELQVVFDNEMTWCAGSSGSVQFWCDGSRPQSLGSDYLRIVASALKVDISNAVKALSRDEERTCGIVIPAEVLCDRVTTAPFDGLLKASYSFMLTDTTAPSVIGWNPSAGATNVDPDTVVQFTFNEPVELGPSTLFLTFTTLDTDNSGAVSSVVSSKLYPLDIPHVSTKDKTILQFDMQGKTNPGWLYSITLPPGSVEDPSGNRFAGLPGGKYSFRVAAAATRSVDSGGSNMTTFLVILSIGLVLGGTCVATLVWRFQGACYGQHTYKRNVERKPGAPVSVPISARAVQPEPDQPAPVSSAPSSFIGTPSQNTPSNAQQEKQQQPTSGSRLSWARSGSPAPKQPERIYPEARPGPERIFADVPGPAPRRSSSHGHAAPPEQPRKESRSSSHGTSSKPPPKPEKPANTVTSPLVESGSPEMRAVEKKMRDMMNEPLAVRKKLLKDLMLEHHPDKNAGSEQAKETFQFINGARGWFLHDA